MLRQSLKTPTCRQTLVVNKPSAVQKKETPRLERERNLVMTFSFVLCALLSPAVCAVTF